jgi:hypothetical protein
MEIFTKKISGPIIDISLKGFTISKMPNDYLHLALVSEIELKKKF